MQLHPIYLVTIMLPAMVLALLMAINRMHTGRTRVSTTQSVTTLFVTSVAPSLMFLEVDTKLQQVALIIVCAIIWAAGMLLMYHYGRPKNVA